MSNNKIKLGKCGEQMAADYLKNNGYKIMAKNYRTREGEIDLICQKNSIIHFIEVKTRTSQKFGWPEEAVTDQKMEKIIATAEAYLMENQIDSEWQIDIISILLNKEKRKANIKHIANISSDLTIN